MDYKAVEKRIRAAQAIVSSKEISRNQFRELRTLISGINPKLDKILAQADKAFTGDVIELTLEHLPEMTPEQKKKKKALLLFLKYWKDLQSEIDRVEKELRANQPNTTGRILSAAKGPLGLITAVAALVAVMKVSEVSVTIKNIDCRPIAPPTGIALNIPGLKVPNETIPRGGEAIAKLPGLSATVDATSPNNIQLKIYGMTFNFNLESSGIRLFFDDKLLNGSSTTINLGEQKTHTLTIRCT